MSGQRLVDGTGARLWTTAGKLVTNTGFSSELGDAIRREGGADRAVQAMRAEFGLDTPSVPVVAVEHDPAPTAPPRLVTVRTSNLLEAMLRAGVHKHARWPNSRRRGMSEEEYGDLWPAEVTYPAGYAERYPHLLLRDDTVSLPDLKEVADADFRTDPAKCNVCRKVPKFLFGPDGKRLGRAVIFWGYEAYLGYSAIDCRLLATHTNIPLIHRDGLWVLVEHRDGIIRRHGIDLLGSSCGVFRAPFVHRFGNARPYFNAYHVDGGNPLFGPGFRGSELVPVPVP
ncbi:MAG: hypothetical protein UX09_C0016G0005 [Candidatus Uhrbacteria bacterium GW2011_GWE2_45_35]|uniref:Uncharacterized protein n=2 Tax=Candidatus Uhriibacteriota TaxID=1752732 RepID=A0A0G1LSD9_9BACT|nr:MAG: hypothetical protein UW63_C0009G0016 [Candidatus Uhrbacteria bacterium GW2011_GWF2_44_350]KKU08541.1 MAG: hypothetical protein UX09_C0016G0005 [Candidatus Uhrbacteria bacterium GW2011_GWE2_45_35]HBR80046.1 hypothetical protein [Candidatus Uhrbacteria bacterium]HCU31135.1 hypothetical protein [Candidatus Uhrbacteria bacterium]